VRKVILAAVIVLLSVRLGPACEPTDQTVSEQLGLEECTSDQWCPPEDDGTARVALEPAGSCDQLAERLREGYMAANQAMIAQSRRDALNTVCYEEAIFGTGDMEMGCGMVAYDSASPEYRSEGGADGDVDGDGDGGASEYSTTNTQEVGVDEADFIKNDGEYIYVVSGGQFQIIRAWPAEETETLSSTAIAGSPRALFVYGGRAVIYAYDESGTCYDSYNYDNWYSSGCTTGTTTTTVTVLDISDVTSPRLERTIELQGAYVNSRRIDGAIYTVVTSTGLQIGGLRYTPSIPACDYTDPQAFDDDYVALIEANAEVVADADFRVSMPTAIETTYDAEGAPGASTDLFGDCDNVLVPSHLSGSSFLSVLSFELGDSGPSRLVTVVGEQGVVYSSAESLYVASVDALGPTEGTTLHRFALGAAPAAASYEASGRVPGRVLNQFSLGEYEGFLRIATTTGHVPGPAYNDVFVLEQQDDELVTVGEVRDIAPDEDIRSARFVGDRGFVVTFKKTDPLFVLDLADPVNPQVAGELEIPGFSTYMHMMDANHLLTIGYDADDMGDFAWFDGIQLQIFDVTDMSDPRLDHRHLIGTRGSSSEATTNHLAFNYFRPLDLLALPMVICEGGGDGNYGSTMTFNGLMVFDVTTEDGFREHGRLPLGEAAADPYGYGSCGSWWTDPSSGVLRSIIMEDYVYSVAADRIQVAQLDNLSEPVATVSLPVTEPDPEDYDW
jgi:hypothetical protein